MSETVFVEQAPERGREHVLSTGMTIGRENCDVTIADPEISRRQAQVHSDDDAVAIEDLGSRNGTFVNGQRISGRQTLQPGDEIRFGDTVWQLKPVGGATGIADRPVADAQVTRARAVPAPEPPGPARQPAAVGARGDVPPPDIQPSAIRRVVPPPGSPAAFSPTATSHRGGSAATRLSATIACTVAIALTTAGVVIYYITEPFK